jgi:DNA invertase Pin-like site-specific DNA recombinase
LLRPAIQDLIQDAQRGRFEIAFVKAMDRLSRDQEDIAGLFKRMQFAGARMVTLGASDVSHLHVGLKGTMNALFLKDLTDKTRRGQRGRIENGKSGGGLCYGYDVVRALDEHGEPRRGDRTINADQAEIIRRIFRMSAGGSSPIAIAQALNAEGVVGPEGWAWHDTTIRGHALRGTGILRNELYIGRLVWNRMHSVRAPETGKRVSRANASANWARHDVPELRIVDDENWNQVQHRLDTIRTKAAANDPNRAKFWENRRAAHLLTSKVFCGVCGCSISNVGRDYLACAAARKQGVCTSTRGIQQHECELASKPAPQYMAI